MLFSQLTLLHCETVKARLAQLLIKLSITLTLQQPPNVIAEPVELFIILFFIFKKPFLGKLSTNETKSASVSVVILAFSNIFSKIENSANCVPLK